MRVFWRAVRLGAQEALAFRTEVLVRVASALLVATLTWSVWSAVAADRDAVAGVPSAALPAYALVAWLWATVYATRIDAELAQRARTGDLVVELLRPVDLQLWHYARDLGRASVALVCTGGPLLAVALVLLPLPLPGDPRTWLWLALSLPLSHGVSVGLAWLVGVAAVRLRSGRGLLALKGAVLALLSGALIPLQLYPEPVQVLANWLPFASLSHGPAALFIGQAGPEVVARQALWVGVLALLGRWAWRRGRAGLVTQGG